MPADILAYAKQLCTKLGICQYELARRLGVHPSTLSKWGRHAPSPLALRALADLACANGLPDPLGLELALPLAQAVQSASTVLPPFSGQQGSATPLPSQSVPSTCIVCGADTQAVDVGICQACREAHAGSNRCVNCGAVEDRLDLPFVCDVCRAEFGT